MANDHQNEAVTQPPSPSSALYFIYQKDGDGALSYEVENGSWTTYWYGYQFDLDGKHYYTGFAYDTPFKFSKAEQESEPAPETKATIAQSTFLLTAPGTDKPWTFQGSDRSVGEFGAYEKGNEIDDKREPQSYRTPGGNLLLAIPTWYLASGTRISSFDLLVFNPHELTKTDQQRWVYVGNVVVGADNGAACDEEDGGKIACASSAGTLSFVPQAQDDLPLLRVARSGTEIAEGGKLRTLGPADSAEYRYDANSKQYQ
ncbi:hypothetical protein CSC74_12645 [Pseudoxanthomonas yeongjuensis]|nr:hypothetical protein CSC74_12645 [Pseudoxanthomonas yeongjuensis]